MTFCNPSNGLKMSDASLAEEKPYVSQAWRLQRVALPSELIAILIAYLLLGKTIHSWLLIASVLMTLRVAISLFLPHNQANFIFSNMLSAIIWGLYGVFSFNLPDPYPLMSALFLTGLCGGAILFLTYIPHLYIAYVLLTILPFGILLSSLGGVQFYVGIGLIVLVIYLGFLSYDYNAFLKQFFLLNTMASQSIEAEQAQIHRLETLQNQIDTALNHATQLEDNILQSINAMQAKTELSLLNLDLFSNEIVHLVHFIPRPLLILGTSSPSFCYNSEFSELFDMKQAQFSSPAALLMELNSRIQHGFAGLAYLIENHQDYHPKQSHFELSLPNGDVIVYHFEQIQVDRQKISFLYFNNQSQQEKQSQILSASQSLDNLTGLLSRQGILTQLEEAMNQAGQTGDLVGVAYLDFNHFKTINDHFGHAFGNIALIAVADRLKALCHSTLTAGRLSGDEFLLLMYPIDYKSDLFDQIKTVLNSLDQPYLLEGSSFRISFSVGLSFYPADTNEAKSLVYYAELAMYEAKKNRVESNIIPFNPSFLKQHHQNHELQVKLLHALTQQDFFLVYQPIYDVREGLFTKVEVLLRWRNNYGPDVFIPMAERLGLIYDLTIWVLQKSCKQRLKLGKQFDTAIKFCINISSEIIRHRLLVDRMLTALIETGCKPEWIEFELTETTSIDYEQARYFIEKSHEIGVSVSMDDFGTGYSSIAYLKNLYFDSVKIDREFVRHLQVSPRDLQIFESMVNFANILGANIVVEGVETKAQFDIVQACGCSHVQGYYFSKPIDFNALSEKLLTQG